MAWYFIEMEYTDNLSSFLMTTFVCFFLMYVLKMRHAFILSFEVFLFYFKISVVIAAVAVIFFVYIIITRE